ncbi:MAG: hypothetical protein WC136_00480 [Sphaerochaeta sp.]|jgi:hypothetical protein
MTLLSNITLGFYNGIAKDGKYWELGDKENIMKMIASSPLYGERDQLFIHNWTPILKDKSLLEAVGYLTNFEIIDNKSSTEIRADCVLYREFNNPEFILKAYATDNISPKVSRIITWEIREQDVA